MTTRLVVVLVLAFVVGAAVGWQLHRPGRVPCRPTNSQILQMASYIQRGQPVPPIFCEP